MDPTIGAFKNHKDNQKNRFTFSASSGLLNISYSTSTNWDIAEAPVSGYSSQYTRLCITASFNGTEQFGIEAKVPGKSDQEIRAASAPSLNSTVNGNGNYIFDIELPNTIKNNGLSAIYIILDPTAAVSGVRSMGILDIRFLKAGDLYPAAQAQQSVVSFDLNGGGGTAPQSQTVNAGGQIALPGLGSMAPPSASYSFIGWCASADGSGAVYPQGYSYAPAGDTKLYAQWQAQSNDKYVALDGSDSTGAGTSGKPWRTIAFGVSKLKPGDTLHARPGIYNEKVNVGVSGASGSYITIKGDSGAIIDGSNLSGQDIIKISNKSYVRIEGFEIRNNCVSGLANGILIEATGANVSSGIQIVSNKITNIDGETANSSVSKKNGHGIAAYGKGTNSGGAIKDLLIDGNEIGGCKLGTSEALVVSGNANGWKITNNYIHDNDNIGIDAVGGEDWVMDGKATYELNRARNGLISGNAVINNNGANNTAFSGDGGVTGIYIDGGKDIVIENNYVYGSVYAIEVGAENKNYNPSGAIVRNNIAFGSSEGAILLGGTYGANDALVEKNTVCQQKGSAIEIQKSGSYTIKGNLVLASNKSEYVYGSKSTYVFSANSYYGGSAKRPTGDNDGQILSSLPVKVLPTGDSRNPASRQWYVKASNVSAGADPQPFISSKWLALW